MPAAVEIECIGESKVVRCMMENLMEVAATERKIVISASRCVGKFPVKKMLSDLRAEESNERWTLTFHDNTGNIQIHSSTTVRNELKEFLAELEVWYVEVCRSCSDTHQMVPEKYQAAIESLRLLACSSTKNVDEDNGDGEEISDEPVLIPKNQSTSRRTSPHPEEPRIAVAVCAECCTFPGARTALLDDMKSHYGHSFEMLDEALVYDGETAFVYIESFCTETVSV